MPGKFNYEKMRKYPHMIGEDTDVWNRFMLRFPNRFDTVDYDIHVGHGAKIFDIEDVKSQNYWTQLTKKRIDVIGYKNSTITIIEVKNRVGLYTLGQILGYRFLYLREYPEQLNVKTLILCSKIDQDDMDLLSHYNIEFLQL
ncbi:hypothetical protein LCGC14_2536030 [marine sediment metagenome]|uniref:Uncharacterized protein n=1 Tax=marine sediment metagenome TaxID=412755 RepID=A0A0F9ASI4_9ZZZZ